MQALTIPPLFAADGDETYADPEPENDGPHPA
ncbi:hypothetical protein MSKU3_0441 [Komagataeibacter oboediens]|nr:hypothetical protein MSKU3_0441 [Komagataeibacter oboediens]